MPKVWRLVHKKYARHAFTGEGARIAGGRWNSEGHAVIYTAGSLSLAFLEVVVHLEFKQTLKHYKAIPVDIPEKLVQTVEPEKLPYEWNSAVPVPVTQWIGNCWVDSGDFAVLEVPSSIIPNESNYLLNPAHPDFPKIGIGGIIDLPVDPRVFEKLN